MNFWANKPNSSSDSHLNSGLLLGRTRSLSSERPVYLQSFGFRGFDTVLEISTFRRVYEFQGKEVLRFLSDRREHPSPIRLYRGSNSPSQPAVVAFGQARQEREHGWKSRLLSAIIPALRRLSAETGLITTAARRTHSISHTDKVSSKCLSVGWIVSNISPRDATVQFGLRRAQEVCDGQRRRRANIYPSISKRASSEETCSIFLTQTEIPSAMFSRPLFTAESRRISSRR